MISIERIFNAYLDQLNSITILLPKKYHNGHSSFFEICKDEQCERLRINEKIDLSDTIKYVCSLGTDPIIGEMYWITDEYGGKTDLQIGSIIRTDEFDKKFFYDGPLGMKYDSQKTNFKLWAPTATKVKLKLYTSDMNELEPIEMNRESQGLWEVSVEKDLEGYGYSFLVCVNLEWKEAVDPYAVSVMANGKLGVVVDLTKTRIEKRPLPPLKHPVDAIIYEIHLRDFTIHPNSGVKEKGTYLGAAELDTKGAGGTPTCLSYVKDLGVTHLEILPLHDFEGVDELGGKTDYNWGYNPIHFNAPEGSYSSDPKDPYARIKELKQLITTIHDQGLRVILDVVYNHVYIREESSFEKIVPGYYFRHDEHGMPSNGTGVGNDIASERLMVRKFILDSVKYWTEEYDVDGFRFDLMGILDTTTMNAIRDLLDGIDPGTLIIGEGWDLNTPIPIHHKASIRNQKDLPRIGQFNDWFRDSIKGSTFNLHDRGYCLGNDHYYEGAKQVLAGSIGLEKAEKGLFLQPDQSINYVESHDNHTFWDKMKVCILDESDEILKRRQRLATTLVLLSQGIPFIHSGQEFFRTKEGVGNSYRSSNEINQLNWDACAKNRVHIEYLKGIIEIRKLHQAFRLPNSQLIRKYLKFLSMPKPIIGLFYDEVGEWGSWEKIITLFNPATEEVEISLPDGDWKVMANDERSGGSPIGTQSEKTFSLKACSSYVLVK